MRAERVELVRRQLEYGIVWNDPEDQDAVEGLSRAMRVSGTMCPAFGQALADLLADQNVTVRTGAVSALQDFAHLVSADRLAELLRDKPELYSNIEPQGHRLGFGELETAMYTLLGNAATKADSAAIAQLREGARKGQSVVLPALARLDPDWLIQNARDVVSRKAIGGVLIKLPSQAHREKVLKALAPWPDPDFQALLEDGAGQRRRPALGLPIQHGILPFQRIRDPLVSAVPAILETKVCKARYPE